MQRLLLAELLSALGYALDLTEGQPAGHSVRCCWIGMKIGRELDLAESELRDLYYVLLLKDLGCSSNAARICQLYLTDDFSFKRDFKSIDGSLPQALRFVLGHTGLQAGLSERFRAILNVFRNGGEIARELIETRCQRGADIARRMRFPEPVALGIRDLDEHWNGGGKPAGLQGAAISLYARIALIAQVVDVFFMTGGQEPAFREVANRSGTWFDPAIAAAFGRAALGPDFWRGLGSPDIEKAVMELAPSGETEVVDDDYLDDIAAAFAQVIDSKSPYTHGHSGRVTLFSDMIAEELGLTAERRRWLRRVALLHDIGKLGVSNTILDKPGKLDDGEWTAMRRHAAFTEEILSRIGIFSELAFVAGAHHERLDGKGYPRGLSGDAIPLETRIVSAADIFDALTAERPYRAAMPVSQALSIMRGECGSAVDKRCYDALTRAMARLEPGLAA
jgi:HD-GYP domain-containing protein (c-di-GMP phosphodiesterase class II)